jgi:hypothetical protein
MAHSDAALKPVLDYLARASVNSGGDDGGAIVSIPKTEAGAKFAAMKRKLQGSVAKKSGKRPSAGHGSESGSSNTMSSGSKGGPVSWQMIDRCCRLLLRF